MTSAETPTVAKMDRSDAKLQAALITADEALAKIAAVSEKANKLRWVSVISQSLAVFTAAYCLGVAQTSVTLLGLSKALNVNYDTVVAIGGSCLGAALTIYLLLAERRSREIYREIEQQRVFVEVARAKAITASQVMRGLGPVHD